VDRARSILVVDNDQDAIKEIASSLSEQGFEVVSASLWTEAIARIQEKSPDIVLLDLNLPTVRGDALLEFIRETDEHLPVVVVASEVDAGSMERLDKLKANGFVRKPFDPDDLLVVIEHVLAESALQASAGATPEEEADTEEDDAQSVAPVLPGSGAETLQRRALSEGAAPPPVHRVRRRRPTKRRSKTGRRVLSYVLVSIFLLIITAVIWSTQELLSIGNLFGISFKSSSTETQVR